MPIAVADGKIIGMDARPLTQRERAVLERGEVLGGIDWLCGEEAVPDELPSPERLDIRVA